MTKEEKRQKLYHLYAIIGECTTNIKQKNQEIALFNQRISEVEEELVETLKIQTMEITKSAQVAADDGDE